MIEGGELWGHIDIAHRREIIGVLDGSEGNVERSICLRVRIDVEVIGLNILSARREQNAAVYSIASNRSAVGEFRAGK